MLARNAEGPLEMCFRFRPIRHGRQLVISPAVRWISASHNFSLVVSTIVIASPMQLPSILELPELRMGACQVCFLIVETV